MESRYINRYRTFCRSLKNLEKSRKADPKADFVLEGTVLNFNLTFDISWKVMEDILVKRLEILGFAVGSPRETLKQAFTNGLIDDDQWMQMLRVRNQLAHDYDGTFAAEKFQDIIQVYYPLFVELKENVKKYYSCS
ncbi:MAG: toxin-antitoxin system antitoxin subunit [Ruminococcus sp.]|nr:toxin-antitoxin system antitoxin subunit [Ruminococcus sp.]